MRIYRKRTLIICWIAVICIAIIAFSPFKIPDYNKEFNKPNRILVAYQSCTCCPQFKIDKGSIIIPDHLKDVLKNNSYDVTVSGNSPLNALDDYFSLSTYHLLISSKFILEGNVKGADSSDCEVSPIFSVTSWTIDRYYPRFLTWGIFQFGFIIIYPIITLIPLISTGFYIFRNPLRTK